MKTIKIIMLLGFYLAASQAVKAQQCYRPEPMTAGQINTVKGVWKGNYDYNGKTYPITVRLYTNNNITCVVDVPPVAGKETGEQIRFCGGGEFHFKKYVDDLSYEFQGTPKNGKIEGLLTVRKNDEKVGANGRFKLSKVGE